MSHWLFEPGNVGHSATSSALDDELLEPTPLYEAVVDAVTTPAMAEAHPPLVAPEPPSFPDAGAVECLICRRVGPVEAAVRHGDGWVGPCCSADYFPNGNQETSERSPQ
ncbi:hypothetical protein [Amycolatopsis tucumanensis]|uniref:Uncharacterized protein n=1 Tax=Amycolatopsis tucumanensis TaxID=401106 RepID=A0ABP7HF13_9PSEU|nr:hypothetical protein [Amycolatopsis tucumanensis]MCF6423712.1 hypothetical protein [Amycolatopsis tucumanensis]